MLEVKTIKQMSTEELETWYKELSEAFWEMERGSYEYDCADADLQYIWECLVERGVR
jgi:hypothetical protein